MELLHLRARWYSPSTGTFLSVDPVESEPPYQYVRGNPVNRGDPSGLCEANDPICWATYERILTFCPECADLGLYDKDTQSLERILGDVMNGWRPNLPNSKPQPWGWPPSPLINSVYVTFCELVNPCQEKLIPFLPHGTASIGPSVLIGAGVAGRAGLEFAFDNQGNLSVLFGAGGGGLAGESAGGGIDLKFTNAPTVDKLKGWSVQLGGSIGEVFPIVGVEWVLFKDDDDNSYKGLAPSIGVGEKLPVPAEIHFTMEHDWVLFGPYNYRDGLSLLFCKK